MGEQGHDDHDRLCRSAQPIEDGAFACAEGCVTRMTDEPLLLLRMDTDIALAALASGRTVLVGAACRRGVHDAPPGCAWKTLPREVCLDPRLLYNCTVPRFGVELPCKRISHIPPDFVVTPRHLCAPLLLGRHSLILG